MGSIPLLASTIRPVEQPDVLQNYGRLQQLRGMQQDQQQQAAEAPYRQQILQQQAATGQIGLEQQQQAQKDMQASTAAFDKWDGKSYDDLAKGVVANGGSYAAAQKVQDAGLKLRSDAAKLQGEALDMQIKRNGLIAPVLASVMDVPDDQLAQTVAVKAQELGQQGLFDPQHVQQALQLAQSGDPAKIRQGIAASLKGVTAFSSILDEQKQKETERHNQASEATAAATAQGLQAYRGQELKQGAQRIGLEAAKLKFQQAQAGVGDNGQPNTLAQAIATGHITPDRMGYLLSKNPGLLQGVMQIDPTFDSSKAQSYPTTYKDFTSGKTSIAINAGGTALSHLHELSEMNTVASHIPGTPDYNAYQNKADTVASELAKFYGDATIPAIASIKKTLTSTLPGNRQAAIETQAQSMGDKLDSFQQQWENAAPSKNYQAPMPGISQKAITARAALDPKFKASQGSAGTPAPQTHIFSVKAWQQANPKGDANAAINAAKQQGYQVIQ